MKWKTVMDCGDRKIWKKELVKKKNNALHGEPWVQCDHCETWVHQVCALFNARQNMDLGGAGIFHCPNCRRGAQIWQQFLDEKNVEDEKQLEMRCVFIDPNAKKDGKNKTGRLDKKGKSENGNGKSDGKVTFKDEDQKKTESTSKTDSKISATDSSKTSASNTSAPPLKRANTITLLEPIPTRRSASTNPLRVKIKTEGVESGLLSSSFNTPAASPTSAATPNSASMVAAAKESPAKRIRPPHIPKLPPGMPKPKGAKEMSRCALSDFIEAALDKRLRELQPEEDFDYAAVESSDLDEYMTMDVDLPYDDLRDQLEVRELERCREEERKRKEGENRKKEDSKKKDSKNMDSKKKDSDSKKAKDKNKTVEKRKTRSDSQSEKRRTRSDSLSEKRKTRSDSRSLKDKKRTTSPPKRSTSPRRSKRKDEKEKEKTNTKTNTTTAAPTTTTTTSAPTTTTPAPTTTTPIVPTKPSAEKVKAKMRIREKVKQKKDIYKVLKKKEIPLTMKNLHVRVVSNREAKHYTKKWVNEIAVYPENLPCRSKCILMFQTMHGIDVCIFGMYVYEYGEDCPPPNRRCVYIAYLDSVHYLRPRRLRTAVYHELLCAYIKFCRIRQFHSVYIWACPPPNRRDDYILHCHPEDQRMPSSERLRQWYATMLR